MDWLKMRVSLLLSSKLLTWDDVTAVSQVWLELKWSLSCFVAPISLRLPVYCDFINTVIRTFNTWLSFWYAILNFKLSPVVKIIGPKIVAALFLLFYLCSAARKKVGQIFSCWNMEWVLGAEIGDQVVFLFLSTTALLKIIPWHWHWHS